MEGLEWLKYIKSILGIIIKWLKNTIIMVIGRTAVFKTDIIHELDNIHELYGDARHMRWNTGLRTKKLRILCGVLTTIQKNAPKKVKKDTELIGKLQSAIQNIDKNKNVNDVIPIEQSLKDIIKNM